MMTENWDVLKFFNELAESTLLPAPALMKLDLLYAMEDPNLHIYNDDKVVAIKVKNPKAEVHFLVLPKEDIPTIKHVKPEHIGTLWKMDQVAKCIVKKIGGEGYFWFGYHGLQSQERLHLHAISKDLIGVGMNTVWKWNSFTTPFFFRSQDVLTQLENRDHLRLPSRKQCLNWLNREIHCQFCPYTTCDVYLLKDHVREYHLTAPVLGSRISWSVDLLESECPMESEESLIKYNL